MSRPHRDWPRAGGGAEPSGQRSSSGLTLSWCPSTSNMKLFKTLVSCLGMMTLNPRLQDAHVWLDTNKPDQKSDVNHIRRSTLFVPILVFRPSIRTPCCLHTPEPHQSPPAYWRSSQCHQQLHQHTGPSQIQGGPSPGLTGQLVVVGQANLSGVLGVLEGPSDVWDIQCLCESPGCLSSCSRSLVQEGQSWSGSQLQLVS